MERTEHKCALVAGAGISGIGAAKMLLDMGEQVILYDGNESLDREELARKLPGARILLGELSPETASGVSRRRPVVLKEFHPAVMC